MFTKEDIIHSYFRSEAIEDGALIDLTETLKKMAPKTKINSACITDTVMNLIASCERYAAEDHAAALLTSVYNKAVNKEDKTFPIRGEQEFASFKKSGEFTFDLKREVLYYHLDNEYLNLEDAEEGKLTLCLTIMTARDA